MLARQAAASLRAVPRLGRAARPLPLMPQRVLSSASVLEPLKRPPAEAYAPKRRAPGAPRPTGHVKHVNPRKRANKVMMALNAEIKEELRARQAPEAQTKFAVGDKVRVTFLQAKSEDKPDVYEGVVIAHPKKGADESILVRGMMHGDVFEIRVPLYSPLLKAIEVVKPRCIHKGKKAGKRVRRAKLYYLRDREPNTYL